ncbi:MAG: Crp/Fnr family transcriptional regulator [Anaerolineaceae bacterium]|nr:Crp/Fnr family transcriptional regulator [Anaerolineaceae bacterium]
MNLDLIPLFSGLSEKQHNWLLSRLTERTFYKNQELIESGMPGEFLYIILSGTVKVFAPQRYGEEVIVAILGPGDPVGEMSVIDSSGRSASVIALEETRVLWINQSSFQEALQTMPVLAQNLIGILNNRLRTSSGQIQALAALDVQERVIRQLLSFAARYGQPAASGKTIIPIRLTQSDLAGLVGASRRRVNQAIVALKHSCWVAVDVDFHITLLDQAALEREISE